MDYTATETATGSVGEEFVGKMSAEVERRVVIMTLSLSLSTIITKASATSQELQHTLPQS